MVLKSRKLASTSTGPSHTKHYIKAQHLKFWFIKVLGYTSWGLPEEMYNETFLCNTLILRQNQNRMVHIVKLNLFASKILVFLNCSGCILEMYCYINLLSFQNKVRFMKHCVQTQLSRDRIPEVVSLGTQYVQSNNKVKSVRNHLKHILQTKVVKLKAPFRA
jgi:hypothetical protein